MSAPDFRTLMVETERVGERYRSFAAIPAGPFRLSVQASSSHYSSPRDVRPVGEYSSFEIAIIRGTGHGREMINPGQALPVCPAGLMEGWESGDCPVGGYIPVERIQRLFEMLCEVPQ
jgi:hypothetical protein